MSLLRNLPDCSSKKHFRDNSNILIGEVKHISTLLITNNNLPNKRDNTEEAGLGCFIEWLFWKIGKFHRITSEIEEACKF